MTGLRIAAIVVAALALSPASAQQAAMGDSAKDMLGPWEFSNADRDKRCTATFRNTAVKGGFRVEFDADCANLFPFVADVAGWRFPENDNRFLFDAGGKTLAEFSEGRSLGIRKAHTGRKVSAEDSILSCEVFILEQEFLIDQPGDVRQQPSPFVVWHEEHPS